LWLLQIRGIKIRSQKNREIDYKDFRRILNLYRDIPTIVLKNIGITIKGAIDNLPAIQKIFEDLAISKYYIHCDAALSNMILFFIDSSQPFSFDHGADNLSISDYKMIGSSISCGVVLVKRVNVDSVVINERVKYAGILDIILMGSRSGFAPLLLWHILISIEAGERILKIQMHNTLNIAEYAVRSLQLAGIPT
jgi:histidine decarboxylase